MVESRSKRDVLIDSRVAFVGDDTGLIKKVKILAKRIEETQTISYDQGIPRKKKIDENGNEIFFPQRKSVLTAADNVKNVRQETDLAFKLLGKFGEQEKDQGILCLGWVQGDTLLSYVRGSENIVQVFDTKSETVLKQR